MRRWLHSISRLDSGGRIRYNTRTTHNNNTTDKGNTMTITITPKADRNRHLTYAETIVATNREGIQLCKPRYGCNWSINQPTGEGTILTHYIGEELTIKAQWNANYVGK